MQFFQSVWALGLINQVLNLFPWTFLFLLFQLWGVRLYHLRNREQCRRIQKRLAGRCTHLLDNNEGAGFCVGFWYLVNIKVSKNEFGDYFDIWLIATQASFETLTKTSQNENTLFKTLDETRTEQDENTISITLFERSGSYSNCYFDKRLLKIPTNHFVPKPRQQEIIEIILNHYNQTGFAVAYIYGKPGTGKSIMGLLLVRALSSSYCNTLQPWNPGDSLASLYHEVEPTNSSPLILVFDEVDTAIDNIHKGIKLHMNIPTHVPDKNGWNRMMDEINWGLYPNLILLLISNKPPSYINSLDPAYIRKGRVNFEFFME